MKTNYNKNIELRCTVCGSDDRFESNEDKSHIKCNNCGKEYFGGYDELVEYNQSNIAESVEQMKEELMPDIKKELFDELKKSFAGNKNVKFK